MQTTEHVIINGQLVEKEKASVPITDLGLLRGYGVFDFFLLQNGKPFYFDQHWNRLQNSAAALHLTIPFEKEAALDMVGQLYQAMPYSLGGVRITLTGGNSIDGYSPAFLPNYIFTLQPLPPFAPTLQDEAISLMTYPYRRSLAKVKSIDYLVGIMLQPEIKSKGFTDVLYQVDGWISECPRSNLFALTKDGVLITPDDGALEGITRGRLIDLASSFLPVEIRPVHLNDLKQAREVWITSTTKGIWPVGRIDETLVNAGKTGPIARKLYSMLLAEMQA